MNPRTFFNKFISLITMLFICISLPSVTVQAQSALNPNLTPNYGSTSLRAGFLPDPYRLSMTSGGSVRISNSLTGSQCRGYASSAPDFRIQLSGSSSYIRFFFVGGGDTTMVVLDANNNWYCGDDSSGTLHPTISLSYPSNGTYDIWVGSYSSGQYINGTLYITELSSNNPSLYTSGSGSSYSPPTSTPNYNSFNGNSSSTGLRADLAPNYETIYLSGGFWPDPRSFSMVGGGSTSIRNFLEGNECRGYATRAPDYRIQWTRNSSSRLRIFFVASQGDPTLVVNDGSGNWYCDDDSYGTLDPTIEFSNPATGAIEIWVGSYTSGGYMSGRLYITELSSYDPSDY